MVLPKLSLEEKQKALEKAQLVRSQRAQIRHNLKNKKITIGEILAENDDGVVSRMRVTYLLESLPRIGKIKAKKIMNDIGIDEARRIQGLGIRQKKALIEKLSKK
ncbi:MAG: integration host factor [Firmicutes bacterium]|nr:integration host factor [Bacillota bacterium]